MHARLRNVTGRCKFGLTRGVLLVSPAVDGLTMSGAATLRSATDCCRAVVHTAAHHRSVVAGGMVSVGPPEASAPARRMECLPGLAAPRDRPIKILQITDMHYFDTHHRSFVGARNTVPIGNFAPGEELTPEVDGDGHGCGYSTGRGVAVLERLLDSTQPTLVVMTGDMIDGRMVSDFRTAMAAILAPIQKRDIPWCFVLGK